MNEELRQNTPSGEKYGIFLLTNNCTIYFKQFIYLITGKDDEMKSWFALLFVT